MKKHQNIPMGEMNPKVDFAFKLIFGNPHYPEITKSLLNAVLSLPQEQQITDIKILNPNIDKRYKEDKYSIMDIHALTNDNRIVNIEMQMINRNDMIERTLHYMSRMVADQLKSGNNYNKLKHTVCINFVDFELFDNNKYAHNEFSYRTERGDLLTNLSQIHFIELPKAENGGIIENEMLQSWVKFLNNPSSAEVKMLVNEYTEIGQAKKILSLANLKQRIRDMYYIREVSKHEKASWEEMIREGKENIKTAKEQMKAANEKIEAANNQIEFANNQIEVANNQMKEAQKMTEEAQKMTEEAQKIVQEAKKKELAAQEKELAAKEYSKTVEIQALAEGSYNAKLEFARIMTADNEPVEKICKYTGLSVEEIQNLQK